MLLFERYTYYAVMLLCSPLMVLCFYLPWISFILLLVAIHSIYKFHKLTPNRDTLALDIRRLRKVGIMDIYAGAPKYTRDTLCNYYKQTTFRDYRLFELGTGGNAMHTELCFKGPPPFHLGFAQQLMYVIAHIPQTQSQSHTHILEIGFGKGSNILFLATMFPNIQFVGIDLIQEHVEFAKHAAFKMKLSNVQFFKEDVCALSHKEASYDVIFGIESLCHLDTEQQVNALCKNAHRVLKQNGKLVIIDGFRSRNHDDTHTEAELAMNLAENGFRIRKMPSKDLWVSSGRSFSLVHVQDIDLTHEALPFWVLAWKIAHCLLKYYPGLLRVYFTWSNTTRESGANFVSALMVAYAMTLGSAEYGVLVLNNTHQDTHLIT